MNSKYIRAAAVLVLLTLIAATPAWAGDKDAAPKPPGKPVVAVSDVSVDGVDSASGASVTSKLCSLVSAMKSVEVRCAQDMKALIEHQGSMMAIGANVVNKDVEKFTSNASADQLLAGSLTLLTDNDKDPARTVLTLSLSKVKTGALLSRKTVSSNKGSDGLNQQLDLIVAQMFSEASGKK